MKHTQHDFHNLNMQVVSIGQPTFFQSWIRKGRETYMYIWEDLLKNNRPLALRGHMTNAFFKHWAGILRMPKTDIAHKNYLTPEIKEEMLLLKRDIL